VFKRVPAFDSHMVSESAAREAALGSGKKNDLAKRLSAYLTRLPNTFLLDKPKNSWFDERGGVDVFRVVNNYLAFLNKEFDDCFIGGLGKNKEVMEIAFFEGEEGFTQKFFNYLVDSIKRDVAVSPFKKSIIMDLKGRLSNKPVARML
ncbi:MAG: hypothetical protein ACHQVK_01885, partial [Candidatus Paceibacterales bacterium]